MRTREQIADELLHEVEEALLRFKNAEEFEKTEATAALQRALHRHTEFVLQGKVPQELSDQLSLRS